MQKSVDKKAFAKAKQFIEKSSSFILTGHVNPDGDTIGSELAIYSWLISLRKKVEIINADPLPQYLSFLKNSDKIKTGRPSSMEYSAGIIFECPDMKRAGGSLSGISIKNIINIDHHLTNKIRKKKNMINLIDPAASSCAEIVHNFMSFCNHKPDKNEATALFTGIVTDTNRFQQTNTTPQAMKTASELLSAGADAVEVSKRVYNTKSYPALKLLAIALETLKQLNSVAYMKLTRQAFLKTSATPADVEEIVNYAGMLPGVEVYALFRELEGDKPVTKVSLRSHKIVNVNEIAGKYGGGGHYNAAGFKYDGTADETIEKVLPVLLKKGKKVEG
ncbi:MAG: bifunctional oligoribonuclease/PAP phosphatase NrnA [Elusimicrobiota bacterium]